MLHAVETLRMIRIILLWNKYHHVFCAALIYPINHGWWKTQTITVVKQWLWKTGETWKLHSFATAQLNYGKGSIETPLLFASVYSNLDTFVVIIIAIAEHQIRLLQTGALGINGYMNAFRNIMYELRCLSHLCCYNFKVLASKAGFQC